MNDNRLYVFAARRFGGLPAPPNNLSFGDVQLRFVHVTPGDPSRGFVPDYHFRILNLNASDVGHINFRIRDTEHVHICAGHIGFEIIEEFRGHGYAYQACRAIAPFRALSLQGCDYYM